MRRLGFTTMELIIVIVMIGVLATIGFPKIRAALDKTNVRSARVSVATFSSTARAIATQRGCRAVVHFVSGSTGRAWVTACPRYTPGVGTIDTVAMIDDVGARFNVTMTSSRDSVQYDPRGLSMDNATTVVTLTGNVTSTTDSITINPLGKVVR
jgi:Tfp pilus assembly protein FimT